MKISLNQLKLLSQCPRKHWLLNQQPVVKINRHLEILNNVISKAYIRSMEFEYKAEWRRILNWLDTALFADVNISNEEQYNQAKTESEYLLSFINRWYQNMYLPEQDIVYTKIPLLFPVNNHWEVETNIPILKLKENVPTILLIKEDKQPAWSWSHDLEIKGQQLLMLNALNLDNIATECILLGEQGGYDLTTIHSTKKELKEVQNVLEQLTNLFANKVNYPSYSEQCFQCQFKTRCNFYVKNQG